MSVFRRDFYKTNCMIFLIKYQKLLEKQNEIWKKKSATILKNNLSSNLYTMNNI